MMIASVVILSKYIVASCEKVLDLSFTVNVAPPFVKKTTAEQGEALLCQFFSLELLVL
jgi:hypothetical protein